MDMICSSILFFLYFSLYSDLGSGFTWSRDNSGTPDNKKNNQCRLGFKHNKYVILILINTDSKGKSNSGSINEVENYPDCF